MLPGRGCGLLAPRQAQLVPWHEVAIDLIGPWEIQMHGYILSFRALTIVDTVTNFCEVVKITTKKVTYIGLTFEKYLAFLLSKANELHSCPRRRVHRSWIPTNATTLTLDTAISTTIHHAAQVAIHNTMNISPESLVLS